MIATEEQIVGAYATHQRVLQKQLESGTIVHASCFVGAPEGGQYALANWYAMSLLGVPKADANTLVHADLRVIAPTEDAPRIGIEQVREIRRHVSAMPSTSSYRVVIVHDADRMTVNAANALLKVLEEPSLHAVLVLTTAYPDRLLGTVRSRVEKWWVPPLSREQLQPLVEGVEGPQREFLLRYSQGRVGRLQQLSGDAGQQVEQDILFWIDFLEGSTAERDTALQTRFLKSADPAVTHQLEGMLEVLESILRDQMLAQYRCERQIVHWKWSDRIEKLASDSTAAVTGKRIRVVQRLAQWTREQTNKKMIFDYLTFVL